jgi:hypothetical protein
MPKQYDRTLLEVEAKRRLEQTRDQLNLPNLSATVNYLIDNLPADKWKPQTGAFTEAGKSKDARTHN